MDGNRRAGDRNQAGGQRSAAFIAEAEGTPQPTGGDRLARKESPQRIALRSAGTRFSPDLSLSFVIGFLALGACIAPWLRRGWFWFEVIGTAPALVLWYDALTLWLARKEHQPVLLSSEKGLRGREGQTIQIPLALVDSGKS